MLLRELEKADGKKRVPFKLLCLDDPTGFGHQCSDPQTGQLVEQVVTKRTDFDRILQEKSAEGFAETERSLSRRVFVQANKFWIIALDGSAVRLQYGGIRVNWREDSGQTVVQDFPGREGALAAYHRLIAQKRQRGYREKFKRDTPSTKAAKAPTAPSKPAGSARKASKAGRKKAPQSGGAKGHSVRVVEPPRGYHFLRSATGFASAAL